MGLAARPAWPRCHALRGRWSGRSLPHQLQQVQADACLGREAHFPGGFRPHPAPAVQRASPLQQMLLHHLTCSSVLVKCRCSTREARGKQRQRSLREFLGAERGSGPGRGREAASPSAPGTRPCSSAQDPLDPRRRATWRCDDAVRALPCRLAARHRQVNRLLGLAASARSLGSLAS